MSSAVRSGSVIGPATSYCSGDGHNSSGTSPATNGSDEMIEGVNGAKDRLTLAD